MSLYAYIDIIEFAAYCVIQEDKGIEYDPVQSRKTYLKELGTLAIISDKDSQSRIYGSNYHWVKIEDGWCVKYRFKRS